MQQVPHTEQAPVDLYIDTIIKSRANTAREQAFVEVEIAKEGTS